MFVKDDHVKEPRTQDHYKKANIWIEITCSTLHSMDFLHAVPNTHFLAFSTLNHELNIDEILMDTKDFDIHEIK